MARTRWDGETVASCLRALAHGASVQDVATATGVPAATIRTWTRGTIPAAGWRALAGGGSCERCGGPPHRLTMPTRATPTCSACTSAMARFTRASAARRCGLHVTRSTQRSSTRWQTRSGSFVDDGRTSHCDAPATVSSSRRTGSRGPASSRSMAAARSICARSCSSHGSWSSCGEIHEASSGG